jgi:hypothetical protein
MNALNVALVIIGSIFLILGGSFSVFLLSVNNGVTTTLSDTGYGMLFITMIGALTGFVLLLLGIATNRNEVPRRTVFQPLAKEPVFCCKVCGAMVGSNQTFCGGCGRFLEWGKVSAENK